MYNKADAMCGNDNRYTKRGKAPKLGVFPFFYHFFTFFLVIFRGTIYLCG